MHRWVYVLSAVLLATIQFILVYPQCGSVAWIPVIVTILAHAFWRWAAPRIFKHWYLAAHFDAREAMFRQLYEAYNRGMTIQDFLAAELSRDRKLRQGVGRISPWLRRIAHVPEPRAMWWTPDPSATANSEADSQSQP